MNTPTNQQLIGYLLGALDPAEEAEIEERLERDVHLRDDLAALHRSLEPLSADARPDAPPPSLAERTCDLVLVRAQWQGWEDAPPPLSRWTLPDMAVAAAVVLMASLLLIPAVNVSRANSQRAGCQNNLRELGNAIAAFSAQHQGLLPQMKDQGDVSFGGAIDPDLLYDGYVTDVGAFVCPASRRDPDVEFRLPTQAQLLREAQRHGSGIRAISLGSYAITLGHFAGESFVPTRNLGRSTFAVLSDSPSLHLPEHRSENHGGGGQNVLHEDGHVRFMVACQAAAGADDIYRNDAGFIDFGLHAEDAVIAPAMLIHTGEKSP